MQPLWQRIAYGVALLICSWQCEARFVRATDQIIQADLLIVGGGESACAAAVQAARLGVPRIVLVNDIDWLGGQFSSEGVGCLDEWTLVDGKRVNFPRSGMFLEMVTRIRAANSQRYGVAAPGNAYCGTETVEPAVAARLFEEWLAPYQLNGQRPLRVFRRWQPVRVSIEQNRVIAVEFESTAQPAEPGRLIIQAGLTIDASDWGDVIRLSGAGYAAGPDLKSRFQEPSAPEVLDADGRQEMNPLSWCVVLRETGKDATISAPASYQPWSYAALDTTPPWVDSDMSAGIYTHSGWSVYTHRRLVDRWHWGFPVGTEATFLNWPVQDYPLCQLPQAVADALEATEPGASRKNIVDLTPAQRQIIFADAKLHALGMLHHLQTKVHDRVGDFPQSFRYMKLTEEFGTADQLPPKPYVREGLRLEALYMLREQDIRATGREPRWARVMPSDAVFGFQFNIDFHPTRRRYETEDRNGAWRYVHTESRNWHTDTDRAMFPLRGLIPVEREGLIGASKNIGVSSVVQSALRLHGQMMLVGQAAGTLAWYSWQQQLSPREIAAQQQHVRPIQLCLVRGRGGPGVLLWPWQDLPPDHPAFESANLLAVRGIWQPDAERVQFRPEQTITRRELARLLVRLLRSQTAAPEWPTLAAAQFQDIPADDPDRDAIETLIAWGQFGPQPATFSPEQATNWGTLNRWYRALSLPVNPEWSRQASRPLTRQEAAQFLWKTLQQSGESFETPARYLQPQHDSDGDGRSDRDDPLPFDRNNNNVPDQLERVVAVP